MKLTLLLALTLDGKIAKDSDHFPDWTEKADKKLFVETTKRAGVLIMGSKTFDTIGKPLPGRKNIVLTHDAPDRYKKMRGKVFTGVEKEWVPVWIDDPEKDLVVTSCFPRQILQRLEKEGFTEAILIGGATINTLFAKENLIDEIIVTISPKIFGSGLSLFDESVSMELELENVERLGQNSLTLKYKVLK